MAKQFATPHPLFRETWQDYFCSQERVQVDLISILTTA